MQGSGNELLKKSVVFIMISSRFAIGIESFVEKIVYFNGLD